MPVTESLLRKTAMLIRSPPPDVPLQAGDAIHTATALETGETEIWTNDRDLLEVVAHFGLAGRSA
jgi:predicted nucleic acid-binding protein